MNAMTASDIRPVVPEDSKTDAAIQAASEIACRPYLTFIDSEKRFRAGGSLCSALCRQQVFTGIAFRTAFSHFVEDDRAVKRCRFNPNPMRQRGIPVENAATSIPH